jgi:hypothetical protein
MLSAMARRSQEDQPEDTETTDADATVAPSEAREKFNRGEITWRELCEAEAQS